MSGPGDIASDLARLQTRVGRERKARLEAEAIAEHGLRELYQKQREVALLQSIAVAANEAPTIEYALHLALDHVCAHTGWPVGHVYLPADDGTSDLVPTGLWHLAEPKRFDSFRKVTEATRLPRGIGLPGRVLDSGKPIWVKDVTQDPNFPRARVAVDIGVRAGFAFPVLVGTDVAAVLEFFFDQALEPDNRLLEVMAHIGAQLGRVAERKRAEEDLARQRDLYQGLLKAQSDLGEGVALIDAQTRRFLYVNDALCEMCGYNESELLALPSYLAIIAPEEVEPLRKRLQDRLSGGPVPNHYETVAIHKGGARVPIEIAVKLVDTAGAPKLTVITRDITERRRAEESLQRLAAIVESSNDAIVSMTLEGRIITWNPGAEVLYGYSAREAIDQPISILVPLPHTDPAISMIRKVKRGQRLVHDETIHARSDGRHIHLSLTFSPIRDAAANLSSISMIARDITEQKRAEEEIRKLNAELEHRVRERTAQLLASNKELEAFSYSVAHDLRAPLRSIDGFSQALLEDYGEQIDPEGQAYLRRVRAATQRMGQLIDDLLNLSRVTRSEMREEKVHLSAMAREIAADLQKGQPERRVDFIIQDGLVVAGDMQLLRVALVNLLGNAWKYTAKHSRARIEFGMTQDNGQPAFYVRDDGAGFDMTYVDKLFGAFQRLHALTEFEGTGIGLATVQRVIQRHGGRVWAEGAVGKGATFFFTLPNASAS